MIVVRLIVAGVVVYHQISCGHAEDHVEDDVRVPQPREVRPSVLTAATTTTPAPDPSMVRLIGGEEVEL